MKTNTMNNHKTEATTGKALRRSTRTSAPRRLFSTIVAVIGVFSLIAVSPLTTTPAQAAWAACWNAPSAAVQKDIQQWLKNDGYYTGAVDGVWGSLSATGIQKVAQKYGGYTGPADGDPGTNTCKGVQKVAGSYGGYTGPQDGILGPNSWAGFLAALKKAPIAPTANVAVTGVSLSPSSPTIDVGKAVTLTATVSPSNASNKTVTWSSNATTIATVSNGVVTGVRAGTATITATASNNKIATVKVTVKAAVVVAVTSVSLSPGSATITEGESVTFKANVSPTNATNQTITWTSSSTSIATVANGTVTGRAAGTATITATSNNGKTAKVNVTVKAGKLLSDKTVTLKATPSPQNGNTDMAYKYTVVTSGPVEKLLFKWDSYTTNYWVELKNNVATINWGGAEKASVSADKKTWTIENSKYNVTGNRKVMITAYDSRNVAVATTEFYQLVTAPDSKYWAQQILNDTDHFVYNYNTDNVIADLRNIRDTGKTLSNTAERCNNPGTEMNPTVLQILVETARKNNWRISLGSILKGYGAPCDGATHRFGVAIDINGIENRNSGATAFSPFTANTAVRQFLIDLNATAKSHGYRFQVGQTETWRLTTGANCSQIYSQMTCRYTTDEDNHIHIEVPIGQKP